MIFSETILGPLIGVIVGGAITVINNFFLEKQKLKREIYLINKNKTDEIYKEIFRELIILKNYYTLFIEPGNELKEGENYKNFGPLTNILNFNNCIEKNNIYLNTNFMKKIESLNSIISTHPSIALQLTLNPDLFDEKVIENLALSAIEKINEIINSIKERFVEEN
ncbi:hypothetical protein [Cetobacterium ceti]